MRLSKFTDYALRACLYLAAHQGRLVPIAEIARAHDLSQSNLMKVVQQLVEGGFVRSTRGRSGGVQLAKPAEEIHAGAVARFMEGETPLVDCASCILNGSCGLVRALAEAKAAFYKALDKYSLADAIGAHPRTLPILMAYSQEETVRGAAAAG
ncbi:RrF2 family transcriptional regulator [Pseudooceanicola sp. 502str34]|uniref:RrF2 family transcriptional regulator n=1 Tax=Maritimibacter alkaliphilus TaxID=404236 RepID=UPI001C947FB2|nr:Rrf2 family transcriptional regulator [Maritimibacter alkaliphilus]MBY6090436.1 Rrf2 family transcriptional regulator [Maritimibacter alkaliphilus]